MSGVAPAPTTVLAKLQPLRVVSLALVRLVVPALALFTRKSGSDPDVSTGHNALPVRVVISGSGGRAAGVLTNATWRREAV
jgi:hypothetical protein